VIDDSRLPSLGMNDGSFQDKKKRKAYKQPA